MQPHTGSDPLMRPSFAIGDRNQVLLCVGSTNGFGGGKAFIARTFKDDTVDSTPPPDDPDFAVGTNYQVFYLRQKAVALILGTVP
jgi:hypothetical protein